MLRAGGRAAPAFTALLAGLFQAAPEAFQGAGKIPAEAFTTELMRKGPRLLQFLENTAKIRSEAHVLVRVSASLGSCQRRGRGSCPRVMRTAGLEEPRLGTRGQVLEGTAGTSAPY